MNKNKSFTLIELLVVIVIIGILAGVIMISTSSSIDKANIAKAKVFSESVKNNLMLNLVSEWNFDEITQYNSSTGVIDIDALVLDSWGNNNGNAKNQPILKNENECISGKCIYFNGSNNYIFIPHISVMDTTTKLTIEAWVNLDSASTDYQCINSDSWTKWYLGFTPNGKTLMAHTRNTEGVGSTGGSYTVSNYQDWYHLVMTVDDSKGLFLHLNGEKKINSPTAFSFRQISSSMQIGSDGTVDGMDYFHGKIDEVKIYSDFLSQSQIKQNYIAGLDSLLLKGSISKEDHNQRILFLSQK